MDAAGTRGAVPSGRAGVRGPEPRGGAGPGPRARLSPAGQAQIATYLRMLDGLEAELAAVRRRLGDAARHLRGARTLTESLYGVGPVTGLALTCWLGGAGRFSSSRKAVRFTGLDITVSSSDSKQPPGYLSRQGPPVLRWCVYEAGKAHARGAAPDHGYYAAVKDRRGGTHAALAEARKIIRQACHILAELGPPVRRPWQRSGAGRRLGHAINLPAATLTRGPDTGKELTLKAKRGRAGRTASLEAGFPARRP